MRDQYQGDPQSTLWELTTVAQKTSIAWTAFSSNPIRYRDRETGATVWGCVRKSAGCTNCYAERMALKWNRGSAFTRPNIDRLEPFVAEHELKRLGTTRGLIGQRIFIGDMTDIFGSWVPDDLLDRLFTVLDARTDITFQILTKRPERMLHYLRSRRWNIDHCWLGTSVENQPVAARRLALLTQCPAGLRFVSAEPLIGPLDISDWLGQLGWVVAGGESGPNFRPMDLEWLAALVDQCRATSTPIFVKQDAKYNPGLRGRIPDELWLREFP
jgi:protein gp37